MANCQNNMRYGRQMNCNSGCNSMPANNNVCRNMPANNSNVCRSMPTNNSNTCCNMPAANNTCGSKPVPVPRCEQPKPVQNNCGCHIPEPPKKECPPTPCCTVEPRMPECKMPKCKAEESNKCRQDVLEGLPIAMAYVPWQKWQNVCDPCKGFCKGTIFEDLSKPFLGKGGCNR